MRARIQLKLIARVSAAGALSLALLSAGGAALAQGPGGPGGPDGFGPPRGMRGPMGGPGMMGGPIGMGGQIGIGAPMAGPAMLPQAAPQMAAAGDFLYILRGDMLSQLTLKSFEVTETVTLARDRTMPRRTGGPGGGGPGQREMVPPQGGPGGPQGDAGGPQGGLGENGPGGPDGQMGPPPGGPDDGGPGHRMGPPQGGGGPGGGPWGGRGMRGGSMRGGGMRGGPTTILGERPAPTALLATSKFVYVLRGNTVYQFSTKGLELTKKTTLPGDMPPMMGPDGMGGRPGMGGPMGQDGMQPEGDRGGPRPPQ